jgi:hypothetical protein
MEKRRASLYLQSQSQGIHPGALRRFASLLREGIFLFSLFLFPTFLQIDLSKNSIGFYKNPLEVPVGIL